MLEDEDAEDAGDDADIAVTITTNTPAVTVIEKNKAACRQLAESFRCTVVCDDCTRQEALLAEYGTRLQDRRVQWSR